MPLSPIFGISTLFHLATIAWNKILELFPGRRIHKASSYKLGNTALLVIGCLIITAISIYVLIGASVLLYSSEHDSHATFRYLPGLANQSVGFVTHTSSTMLSIWSTFVTHGNDLSIK
jgi:hypothetical protein